MDRGWILGSDGGWWPLTLGMCWGWVSWPHPSSRRYCLCVHFNGGNKVLIKIKKNNDLKKTWWWLKMEIYMFFVLFCHVFCYFLFVMWWNQKSEGKLSKPLSCFFKVEKNKKVQRHQIFLYKRENMTTTSETNIVKDVYIGIQRESILKS